MLRKYLLPFALALLFALGQQGAVLHELSHAADYSAGNGTGSNVLQAQPDSQPAIIAAGIYSGQPKQAPHTQLCDKCLGYAQIAGVVASSTMAIPVLAVGFSAIALHCSSHLSPVHLAYSARAPPRIV